MSWPRPTISTSVGTAKSGVPMNTMRNDMLRLRAREPILPPLTKLALTLGVAEHHRVRDGAAALGLPQLHEGKGALRTFQHDRRIDRRCVPCPHHRVEAVLVVDAAPLVDAPYAVALLEEIVEPRIRRKVEQAAVDVFANDDHRVGFEHCARPFDLAAHVAEPVLAVLLGLARSHHLLRALDEAGDGPRIPRHRDGRVRMKA